MRILLDEQLNVRLRLLFSDGFNAETVTYRGWKGLANGHLLEALLRSTTAF